MNFIKIFILVLSVTFFGREGVGSQNPICLAALMSRNTGFRLPDYLIRRSGEIWSWTPMRPSHFSRVRHNETSRPLIFLSRFGFTFRNDGELATSPSSDLLNKRIDAFNKRHPEFSPEKIAILFTGPHRNDRAPIMLSEWAANASLYLGSPPRHGLVAKNSPFVAHTNLAHHALFFPASAITLTRGIAEFYWLISKNEHTNQSVPKTWWSEDASKRASAYLEALYSSINDFGEAILVGDQSAAMRALKRSTNFELTSLKQWIETLKARSTDAELQDEHHPYAIWHRLEDALSFQLQKSYGALAETTMQKAYSSTRTRAWDFTLPSDEIEIREELPIYFPNFSFSEG